MSIGGHVRVRDDISVRTLNLFRTQNPALASYSAPPEVSIATSGVLLCMSSGVATQRPHLAGDGQMITASRSKTEVYTDAANTTQQAVPQKKSWAHFVAGGVGGTTAAIITSPLDVVRTRLQSDFYRSKIISSQAHAATTSTNLFRSAYGHFRETIQILAAIPRVEGTSALFKGLGPTLTGVVPASAIKFFAYGNTKNFISEKFNNGREAAWVHLISAATAGVAVGTTTNPLWVVKTRLQLDKNRLGADGTSLRQHKNSFDCAAHIVRTEGIRGLYRGLTASYLGVSESTLHWLMYEQGKLWLARRKREREAAGYRRKGTWAELSEAFATVGVAGGTKLLATCITYPHEVIRTRLRQAPDANGRLKYTGIVQCFKTVYREEGMVALYGGLTPHVLRSVPSTAIMFGMYELVMRLFSARTSLGS